MLDSSYMYTGVTGPLLKIWYHGKDCNKHISLLLNEEWNINVFFNSELVVK